VHCAKLKESTMLLHFLFGWMLLIAGCTSTGWFDEPAAETKPAPPPTAVVDNTVRKRVLVLPFINRSNVQDESLVRTALFEVKQAVSNVPELILVHEEDLENPDAIYSAGGEYHFRKIFEQAKKAAATGVIVGRIEEVSIQEEGDDTGVLGAKEHIANARVRLQLFDVSTEKEIYSRENTAEVRQERVQWLDLRAPSSESEEGKEAVSRALKKSLERFAAVAHKLAWMGRIARVDINRFYITGGEQTGLRPGQLLRVYENGAPISDPMNGTTLGVAPGRFKGLLKITQNFGNDASVAVLYTGAGFREQDRVELHHPDTAQ
jgi:hypothetical protein